MFTYQCNSLHTFAEMTVSGLSFTDEVELVLLQTGKGAMHQVWRLRAKTGRVDQGRFRSVQAHRGHMGV